MARLIYGTICSLDGYIEDEDGSFDWAEPDEEVHTFVNDLERPIGGGGGKPALPAGVRLAFDLVDERRFGNGVVYLRYRAAS